MYIKKDSSVEENFFHFWHFRNHNSKVLNLATMGDSHQFKLIDGCNAAQNKRVRSPARRTTNFFTLCTMLKGSDEKQCTPAFPRKILDWHRLTLFRVWCTSCENSQISLFSRKSFCTYHLLFSNNWTDISFKTIVKKSQNWRICFY